MAIKPTEAFTRLPLYNGNAYDPATNPYGMALGGHRVNFPQSLYDTTAVGLFVEQVGNEAAASATSAGNSATSADASRQLAERWASNPEDAVVSGGLYSARHYAAKSAASAAAAATFDPANFLSSANGAVGTNNIASNAVGTNNIANGAVTLAKQANVATARIMGRLTSGTGVQEALTAAQVRTLIQSDDLYVRLDDSNIPLRWVTVAAVKLTASAAAIIIPIPAGRKSLRVQGLYRTVADATLQGRISTDGGATYRSASDSYFSGQRTTQNGANAVSADGANANSMILSASGSGNATLPIAGQFFAEFDENSCAQFIYNSAGSATTGSARLISSGLSRTGTTAVPTHIMLFPSSGSFLTGTRLIAEAY